VRIFDSLSSPWFRHDQEMIVSDLLDKKTLAKAISGCEVVYNFAAIADLDEVLNKTIETAKINIIGTSCYWHVMLLEACRKVQVQRYIFASTLYVYRGAAGPIRNSSRRVYISAIDYCEP
jgi:UDP-glucose 4-epimerase